MAETKIISVEAVQSINDLRQNIKLLKEEIGTLTVGTDEYNEKVTELATNQRALKLAMTGVYSSMKEVADASRQDTAALDATVEAAKKGVATYNQMSTALGALKKEIKDVPKYLSETDQAVGKINPAYEELNGKIKVLDTSLKSLDADNGVFTRNVGNYLGALEDWGQTMGNVQQIGQQLITGVMALVGVFSLFGADTEDTKESLASLMPIVMVLNSAKGFGGLGKVLKTTDVAQKALAASTAVNTAANTANAAAAGAATVATEAQKTAQDALNKSMLANPILAVVAAVVALSSAVAAYVVNSNKAAKETKSFKNQVDELNKAQKDQDELLDRELRIKQAQGVSNRELLIQKKENIKAQKAETQAILTSVQARLNQMKADSGWVRFWKGENKQIKNLEELTKQLTEQIKGFDNAIADIDTDIQVDAINKGKEAAKAAAKETEDVVKNAYNSAKAAIKSNKDAEKALNDEYKETINLLNSGKTAIDNQIAAINKKKKTVKTEEEVNKLLEQRDVIEQGILATETQYKKNLDDLKSKGYLKYLEKTNAQLGYDIEKNTAAAADYEYFMRNVLGYTEAQIRTSKQAQLATENLREQYTKIKEIIEQDLSDMGVTIGEAVSGISWADIVKLSKTDAEKLAKNIGEPAATALVAYFENDKNIKDIDFKALEEKFTRFGEAFSDAISKGTETGFIQASDAIWGILSIDGIKDSPYWNEIQKFISDKYKEVVDAAVNFNPSSIKEFEGIKILIDTWYSQALYAANFNEEKREKLIRERNELYLQLVDNFNQSYVASTTEALSAVSDLWEQMLKVRYKKLVESGKMTQEEADKQAEQSFKAVKALQIGVAAINTAAAIISALADPTVPSYYVKAANAVAAGLAGAAQIAQISMTEFGAPSVKTTDVSTPSLQQAPDNTITYTVGLNPQDYAEANASQPIRAYVVDTDLRKGLDNLDSRNNETTF